MKKHLLLFVLLLVALASCQKEEISLSTNANDTFFLREKGNSMPINVRGNTRSKTILLIVHGGPGDFALGYRDNLVINTLETDFAVAYWDQRSGGASQGNLNLPEPKYEDIIRDFEKVVTLLQYRYGKDISLFVYGHSWGGFLTPAYLVKGDNQKNIKGWIQSNGNHDLPLLNGYSIEMIKDKSAVEIAANRNVATWTEMRDYCNGLRLPLSIAQTLKLNVYAKKAVTITPEVRETGTLSDAIGDFIAYDVPLTAVTNSLINSSYNVKLYELLNKGTDLRSKLPLITVPCLLLAGKWDFVCPPKLTDDVAAKIGSTYKKTIVYNNSGHNPMSSVDKQQYWADIKEFIIKFK